MRCVLGVCVCLFLICSSAFAQEGSRGQTWLRRATLVAFCAASYLDYRTTTEGARLGPLEGNGWMADSNGRPKLGLMLGVKAGMRGMMALTQETSLMGRRGFRVAAVLDRDQFRTGGAVYYRYDA